MSTSEAKETYQPMTEYQYAYRSSTEGLKIMNFNPRLDTEPKTLYHEQDAYYYAYSPDGQLLAIVIADNNFVPPHRQIAIEGSKQGVPPSQVNTGGSLHQLCPRWINIVDTKTWQVIHCIKNIGNVEEDFYWSPKGKYLVTFQSLSNSISSNKSNSEDDYNLKIWSVKYAEEVLRYKYASKQGWPLFQWTEDEKVALRYYSGQLHALDWLEFQENYNMKKTGAPSSPKSKGENEKKTSGNEKKSNGNKKSETENEKSENENEKQQDPQKQHESLFEPSHNCPCAISPSKQVLVIPSRSIDTWSLSRSAVAVYLPERPGQPGTVQIYALDKNRNCDTPRNLRPISLKNFYRADQVSLLWHNRGQALLALASTHTDQTGQAYYGNTFLHYLSTDGKSDENVVFDKDGPIHDVQWNPKGNDFTVTYGFMPAKTALFNKKCKALGHLGSESRNKIIWSPQGRIIAIGGFGQLNGEFDIWDTVKLTKVGSAQAYCSSIHSWSPDGKYLLTAVTWPRMRVDNDYKIFDLAGHCIFQLTGTFQIWKVSWKPQPHVKSPYSDTDLPITVEKPLKVFESSSKTKKSTAPYRPPHRKDLGPSSPAFSVSKDGPERYVNSVPSKKSIVGATYKKVAPAPVKKQPCRPKDEQASKIPENQVVPSESKLLFERLKEIQRLLNTIRQLKDNLNSGRTLTPERAAKIQSEEALTKELAQIQLELNK